MKYLPWYTFKQSEKYLYFDYHLYGLVILCLASLSIGCLQDSLLLFHSTENVELVGRRENFMKSNFESLSGADDLPSHNSTQPNNMTISNRYRESGPTAVQRNAATIARAQSFRDNEQNKRREMLQKRIEETRKKLQEVI